MVFDAIDVIRIEASEDEQECTVARSLQVIFPSKAQDYCQLSQATATTTRRIL
jgi:hypothetical protein